MNDQWLKQSNDVKGKNELKIWLNGSLLSHEEATLPVNSAAVFYASNVFEGLRAYWNEDDGELYCFRLAEHFARFRESMKMMRFEIPYSDDDLYEAVRAVLSGNEVQEDVHMHLVGYVAGIGLEATEPSGLYIIPRRRPRSDDPKGLSCNISSWTRTSDNAIPIRLKSGSNYQNGRLAALQSRADGYDQPIFLNQEGHVAEGTGATFFMVRKGRLVTPPLTADILESITRSTLIDSICPEVFGMGVEEREIARTELYVADEAFFCGSGYEITPITSIDHFPSGRRRGRPDHEAAVARLLGCRARRRRAVPGVAHAGVRRRQGLDAHPSRLCVSNARLDVRVGGINQRAQRFNVEVGPRPNLYVAHALAGSLQQAPGIR